LFHTDQQEYRPVYEIPDYEDFVLQEDHLPSSLISWLDNTYPNTTSSKRQRASEQERRYLSGSLSCLFCFVTGAYVPYAKIIVVDVAKSDAFSFVRKIFYSTVC
jgi:hypothetical protein